MGGALQNVREADEWLITALTCKLSSSQRHTPLLLLTVCLKPHHMAINDGGKAIMPLQQRIERRSCGVVVWKPNENKYIVCLVCVCFFLRVCARLLHFTELRMLILELKFTNIKLLVQQEKELFGAPWLKMENEKVTYEQWVVLISYSHSYFLSTVITLQLVSFSFSLLSVIYCFPFLFLIFFICLFINSSSFLSFWTYMRQNVLMQSCVTSPCHSVHYGTSS